MLKRSLLSVLLFLSVVCAQAQKRVSVDAQIKNLADGKVTTVTRRILCDRSGRVVTVSLTSPQSYLIRNLKGEVKLYIPSTNEVMSMIDPSFTTGNELLYIFLSGHTDDLGLGYLGYMLQKSEYDAEGYLKRTYVTKDKDAATIDLVLKDYLPVYVEYRGPSGNVLAKTYLSGYDRKASFVFPSRVTEITYVPQKKDSIITRTVYSVPDISGKDPDFDYQVPKGAKPADNPLKRLKEAVK
ncbi:MAG: hypothetical protein II791_01270 [Bacteroidales bacterium]|nr:hypothetical protein [Bacteroidales bacterium]